MKTATNTLRSYPLNHLFALLFFSLTAVSCVTINIYFPAAAAEKAAELIVDDVLKSVRPVDGQKKNSETDVNNSQGLLNFNPANQARPFSTRALVAIVDFFVPTASAAGQANISINTPKINSIRKSMGKRQSKLSAYYNSGAVGFTNNGLIAIVSQKGLSIKQKSTVKKLVKSENSDRMALYTEIATANGHPEWQADIQKTFSKTWINKIASGWMYQNASGQWQRK
ncbi:YdbL family protein [sulfur-oxidizing endosymbiont of Gigantopelta aegis]|uniref:YdbL family protein n=1 Tax=sulfur-oxidizing endosymbiont of Gigantopelta aegis TaxID=2794934 RepID=UPI0018DD73CB|nr:YdbL family protein [sulfur-oxidizing endosymbiont of Gigantopelta aegis]